MGLAADVEPALADRDHGSWAGHALADIHASDPHRLAAWLGDPATGAPGGETMEAVAARIAPWLDRMARADDRIVAVTHPAAIRAAIALTLAVPAAAGLAIDIAPLSETLLSFNRQWRLQGLSG